MFTGRNFQVNRIFFPVFNLEFSKCLRNSRKPVPQHVCSWVAWYLTHDVRCSPKRSAPPETSPAHTKENVWMLPRVFSLSCISTHWREAEWAFYSSSVSTSLKVSHAEYFGTLSWTVVKTLTENSRFYGTSLMMLSVFHKPCLDSEGILLGKPEGKKQAENPLPSFLENEIPFFPRITQSKPHPLTTMWGCNATRCCIPENKMKLLRVQI